MPPNRYGSTRSRNVIQAAEGIEAPRSPAWRPGRIFAAWLTYQRRRAGNDSAEIPGWIDTAERPTARPDAEEEQVAAGEGVGERAEPDNCADDVPAAEQIVEPDVETRRAERIRLLSIDGTTDPRNDLTALDVEFAIFNDLSGVPDAFMPPAAPRDVNNNTPHPGLAFLDLYRTMLNEIEGRVDFPIEIL